MSKIKLPSTLQGSYEATDKVIGQRFEHSYLGKIDLSKINETMAKKLVRTPEGTENPEGKGEGTRSGQKGACQ